VDDRAKEKRGRDKKKSIKGEKRKNSCSFRGFQAEKTMGRRNSSKKVWKKDLKKSFINTKGGREGRGKYVVKITEGEAK